MTLMRKIFESIIIPTFIILVLLVVPISTLASTITPKDAVLISDQEEKTINLYADTEENEIITTLLDGTQITVLYTSTNNEKYVYIRYTYINEQDESTEIEGYVHRDFINIVEETEEIDQSEIVEMNESNNTQPEKFETENLEIIEEPNKIQEDYEHSIVTSDIVSINGNSFISTNSIKQINEKTTSLLGHIRNRNVKIYPNINNLTSEVVAGSEYTNRVYYIKKEATLGNQKYYLLSTRASSSIGLVGWVKAEDMAVKNHTSLDKRSKYFIITGTGNAYDTAWGGSKNKTYSLSNYKNIIFHAHLTEKAGNTIWYRGTLNGRTVWIEEKYLKTINVNSNSISEKNISLLGHIRNRNVKIYPELGNLKLSITSGEKLTNQVYYIKKEAVISGQKYYLLSTRPSSTTGLVGWARASDLSTHTHVGVDKKAKTFYVKGNGKATTKAWGGNKDTVYNQQELSTEYKNRVFQVNLTEKVGNNIWYRGILDGKQVWLHSSQVHLPKISSTSRLGHIKKNNSKFFSGLGGKPTKADTKYYNTVYYIKRQAVFGEGNTGETYYLLSTQPSDKNGLIGWINASDIDSLPHVGIDNEQKLFQIKGEGKATAKAWGGNKDEIYSSLTTNKGKFFHVNLTEKVGNDIWYRGNINGEGPTVWIRSNYVDKIEERSVSRLGHIRNRNVQIYKDFSNESFIAGSQYTNAVYYVKKEISLNGQNYSLLSLSPSAVNGVVGWAKSEDLSLLEHTTVSKQNRVLKIKGTGKAYSKAWGGSKDLVYNDMSSHSGKHLHVNLTEKVGNNTWYRGKINGEGSNIWLHSSYLEHSQIVVIDPGHGGSDPGALGNGLKEKDLNLKIAQEIKRYLENNYIKVDVLMTRTTDNFYSLEYRTKFANDRNADLFVSVHINAGGGTGFESYTHNGNRGTQEAKQIQQIIHENIVNNVDVGRDRGKKSRDFHVLRETQMPAVLFEYLFIDTKSDADKLKSDNFLVQLGRATAEGIAKALGLQRK